MRSAAARRGLEVTVDSGGTGDWHTGQAPDDRAVDTARANGVDISGLRARQVTVEDFHRFDLIVALDRSNLRDLRAIQPDDATARLSLMLDHVPGREGQSVADPWYGDAGDFAVTWTEVSAGAQGLLDGIEAD